MKPVRAFWVLIIVGALCALLMLVFPSEGIQVHEDFVLKFPNWNELTKEKMEDSLDLIQADELENYLDLLTLKIDSVAETDSLIVKEVAKKQEFLKIKLNHDGTHPLASFFSALEDIKKYKKMRILHFGDSQVESDRITGYLRNEFQKKYGGTGCGFLPLYSPVRSFALITSNEGEWKRYAVYGKKNPDLHHKRFGLDGGFARFTPILEDSLINDSMVSTAAVEYKINRNSYNRNKQYSMAKLYFEGHKRDLIIRAFQDEIMMRVDTLKPSQSKSLVVYDFIEVPDVFRLEFEGVDSPDFYGLSFESEDGIHVDNFGMRGSSGTIFRKMDRPNMQSFLDTLNVGMVILQYGGNALPFIKDSSDVADYTNWFKSQVKLLKNMCPASSFILIGPSDMSEKVDGEMVTRKWVLEVNNAMRKVAEDTDIAYWDLYEVMGGENSMVAWVEQDPPLAAKDYIHFSPRGARKVGELFYKSIQDEYKKWKNRDEKSIQ